MGHSDDYLTPEQTETLLRRAASVGEGGGIPLSDIIADLERDPEFKAALDAARADLRARIDAGVPQFALHRLELTERGFKSVPACRSRDEEDV